MNLTEKTEDFGLFGGRPLFPEARTTGQLANRDPNAFFALMSGAFDRRRLSNQGPLVAELETQLKVLHGTKHAIAVANACFALILSMRALAKPGAHRVVMPSFTFRGLPHLVRWAGLEPKYCDVDPVHHTLAPEALAHAMGPDVALVLAVDTASALCDIDALEAISRSAGVSLLLDSVYGIGGSYGEDPVGSRGDAAVFSLHATKLLNGFEGGYLTTNDDNLAATMLRQRNFGIGESALIEDWGLNAKLNEIHAAQALANLPHINCVMSDNRVRFEAYQDAFRDISWVNFADYSRSPGNYSLVLLQVGPTSPYSRDDLIRLLRAENALVRSYYSPPLHWVDQQTPCVTNLPATDKISREFIQMPVGDHTSIEDIWRLGDFFRRLDRQRMSITTRMMNVLS